MIETNPFGLTFQLNNRKIHTHNIGKNGITERRNLKPWSHVTRLTCPVEAKQYGMLLVTTAMSIDTKFLYHFYAEYLKRPPYQAWF